MASRGKKWLIGCGAGCGALILLVIAVAVGFFIWLNQPTELLQPETLLGSETTGHVEWTLRLEDPGTKQFVESIMAAANDQSAKDMDDMPPVLRSWLLKYQGRQNEKNLRELFPMAVSWTVYPGHTPEEDVQLISLSVKRLGNKLAIADWLMGLMLGRTSEVNVIRHADENIYSFPNSRGRPVVLFIRKNNIFFANDVEGAERAVDRLENPVGVAGAGDLAGMMQSLPADLPLRGALTNERGELRRLWRQLVGPGDSDDIWAGVSEVKLSGGFREGENFGGLIELRCRDASWARANAESIGAALSSALSRGAVEVETNAHAEGDWVEVEFELKQVQELFKELLRMRHIRVG